MMSIAALIQAAEYLDRREREAEHGYASTLPITHDLSLTRRRTKSKKSQGNRTTHNELEKNRRAHLRNCLEKLKEMVPLGPESSRHTTLGLLTKAKSFIRNLEEKDRKHQTTKEQLMREQRYLRRRLDQLQEMDFKESLHKRRSISECSSGMSSISSNSEPETNETLDSYETTESARLLHSFALFKVKVDHNEHKGWPVIERGQTKNFSLNR
ncbi:max dimerization protein 1-like [Oppia nitens]|uniref:max dimerization protein 1-like n=1 Tax=Oppia nitens TaxID=1686743 RepID=UPI0023DA1E96|nr:max dimerization protein 1-like [Oppia nitens]